MSHCGPLFLVVAVYTAAMSLSPSPSPWACLYSSFTAVATGRGWPTLSPMASARRRSFCWCLRGKLGSKLPVNMAAGGGSTAVCLKLLICCLTIQFALNISESGYPNNSYVSHLRWPHITNSYASYIQSIAMCYAQMADMPYWDWSCTSECLDHCTYMQTHYTLTGVGTDL